MALQLAGAALGGAAVAAYLDGRYHIRNDLGQDFFLIRALKAFRLVANAQKNNKMLVYHIFEDRAGTKEGDNIFLMFEGRQWTYTEFYQAIQPVANWLLKDLGIQKDEMVALDGTNSPEFLLLWFAIESIGASTAFINHNLTDKALVHCVNLCNARYLLASQDVHHLVSPVEDAIKETGARTIYYDQAFFSTLQDRSPLPKERQQNIDPQAVANLLFTSGTTGMPKGTITSRFKEINLTSIGRSGMITLKPGDRMYTCLPLFHGAAHGLCVDPIIGSGATLVLSRKFSHKTFWKEVHESGATHIQYVGELCRYLVNAPPSPLDKGHKVRMAWGNGLRPDVWETFRERFGIESINELYAASDGMGSSSHPNRGEFTRYAIGVRGALWHLANGWLEKRVLIDTDTQEVIRGADGFAIEAKTGEAGETISYMNPSDPDSLTPTYYRNHGAAVKRRVRDVFKKGDMWFRSGDLMRLDEHGRLYFVDRLGDTFRWHSENVSTNEVSDVVGDFAQIAEANVYGVLVPKADGRAGCAAIVPREGVATGEPGDKGEQLDWRALAEHCLARLPRYAVPVFMRLTKQLEYTGTMKLQKGRLRAEGVELGVIEENARQRGELVDRMYWLPPGTREYVPFGDAELQQLKGGGVRL